MPKKAIDYSNTIIYKIQHQDNDDLLYVGHTTDFTKRKCKHKNCSNNPNDEAYNRKVYKMIRDNGGWDAFNMIEISKFPCNDSKEASAEEDRIMREMKTTMNSYRAYTGLTKKEHKMQWDIDNADKVKKYRIDNKDKKRDYDKNYRIKNRAKIREYNSQKMTCECGAVFCKTGITRHLDTSKHFRYVQNNIK